MSENIQNYLSVSRVCQMVQTKIGENIQTLSESEVRGECIWTGP